MSRIAEGVHSEICLALTAFLAGKHSYRCGSRTKSVPQHHGRYSQQMPQHNALHAEMAEQRNSLPVGSHSFIDVAITLIAVTCQYAVNAVIYLFRLVNNVTLSHLGNIIPLSLS